MTFFHQWRNQQLTTTEKEEGDEEEELGGTFSDESLMSLNLDRLLVSVKISSRMNT